MRYVALATDYDGTLALNGRVHPDVAAALGRLRESGRKTLLVTGRELDDLQTVCEDLSLFDYVVAENGALLYDPATHTERPLGSPPDERLLSALHARNVSPLTSGRVIVATREPHESTVLDVIHELGLELQVIFNKGAVMILPTGINKASGLAAALDAMGLSAHNVVGIGDAENDHAFLRACEAGIAVANALPSVREQADLVMRAGAGRGVIELIEYLIADDLQQASPHLARHRILLGTDTEGAGVTVEPYGTNIMIAGTSGSGKSTLTQGLLERLAEQGYEFCLVDPEGDYGPFANAVTVGDQQHPPAIEEIQQVMSRHGVNVIVNLLGVLLDDRAAFLDSLLLHVQELRAQTARPHWLVIDEAHHMLAPPLSEPRSMLANALENVLMITPHPQMVDAAVLARIDTLIAVGHEVPTTVFALANSIGIPAPPVPQELEAGDALVWPVRTHPDAALRIHVAPAEGERRRHERKYVEGELGLERSFYFHGPNGELNLRAQNLMMFMQIADGVDEETWRFHLEQHDYSQWFREMIKDEDLAAEAERIEANTPLSADESRAQMRAAIEARYTLPGTLPTGSHAEPPS